MTLPVQPRSARVDQAARWLRAAFVWGGLAFLTFFGLRFIKIDALKYLEWSPDVYLRFWPQRYLLAAHVLTATIALTFAPLQFVTAIRKRWPRIHRMMGWTYIVCCIVSVPFVMQLSTYSTCPNCVPPFVIWAGLWFATTSAAMVMAVKRRFDVHKQFMVRSWMLMNGFVLVRLDGAFHFPVPDGPGIDRVALIIWLAWIVPFLGTELWFSWSPLLSPRKARRPASDVA